MSTAGMPAAARPQTGRRRSKTGCRTCRARRIKCDENPVACHNCTSTGRRCDGYDAHRLPPKEKVVFKHTTDPLPPPGQAVGWAMTSDERRCLSYFSFHTVPTLLQFFDSTLWQKLVLQLSRSEPPVYHAIVALSAIHQNSEEHGMPLATPTNEAGDTTWHLFADDQLTRSITLLNQRRTSQDPRLREVILVCCLLFLLADLLRGRYEDAFHHLRSGLRILKQLRTTSRQHEMLSARQSMVEDGLVSAFAHLDILAAHYDRVFPILCPNDQSNVGQLKNNPDNTTPSLPSPFQTLTEARTAFDSLLSASYRFSGSYMGMKDEEIAQNYKSLQDEQSAVWSQTVRFKRSFQPFYTNSYNQLSQKEQRGADIINLNLLSLPICLQSCLLGNNRDALAYYASDLDRICSLSGKIMTKFPERPSFTVENGVIPPLYLAAMLGYDYRIRWRGIELLRSWPHREGPFDSNWCASLAEEALMLELQTRCATEQGFGETKFLLSTGETSVNEMLLKLKDIRQENLTRLQNLSAVEDLSKGATWNPFEAVGPVKGMGSWSCVRAFTAATSDMPGVQIRLDDG
ncbi:hypothetical protein ZTR_04766 [Talaromyces verruculosus]|nr:hypothetical protein ZTR_04766 [Talaromyces verruculosus]